MRLIANPCGKKLRPDGVGPPLLLAPARRNHVEAGRDVFHELRRKRANVVSEVYILGETPDDPVRLGECCTPLEYEMRANGRLEQRRQRPYDPNVFFEKMRRPSRSGCGYLESLLLFAGAEMKEALRHTVPSGSERLPSTLAAENSAGKSAGIQTAALWLRSLSMPD